MAAKYQLYYDELMKHKDAIGTGKPIEIEVMDADTGCFMPARILVSQQPIEGGEAAALMGPFATIVEEGKWFVKVLAELPNPLEE